MDNITIPPESIEKASEEVADALLCARYCERGSAPDVVCRCKSVAFHSGLAMLRAWPGMQTEMRPTSWTEDTNIFSVILPLRQEPPND